MAFKNWWKTKPLWLKYGIYAILIYVILTVILIPFGAASGVIEIPYWWKFSFYMGVPFFWLLHTLFNMSINLGVGPTVISSVIHSFVYGVLIGLIVTKIKSKKKK